MNILDGKKVAHHYQKQLSKKIKDFCLNKNNRPFLVVLLVGDHPASQVYVRKKIKACEEIGIRSQVVHLKKNVSSIRLRQIIQSFNQNSEVCALLVQLPLPKHLSSEEVISWISPLKDVDGLTAKNQALAGMGKPFILPCTPLGIAKLLKFYRITLQGKKAVVVGRSRIVGLPMAHMLLKANATVTICHSHTQNLKAYTRDADLVVVSAGKPHLLGIDDFKASATIIDVGIHHVSPKNVSPKDVSQKGKSTLIGDVRFNEFLSSSFKGWITPVPGGVGPMTILSLLENTFKLAKGC